MNERFYASLTRIALAVALIIGVAGSLLFAFLSDLTQHLPFSNF